MKKNIYTFLLVGIVFVFTACQDAVLSAPVGNVPENALAGYKVTQITISNTGNSKLESLVLKGNGSENFSVDASGLVTVANGSKLDFESVQAYSFIATATNTKGQSVSGDINIQITDIADIVPTIESFSTSIAEDIPFGTLVGTLNITDSGDSDIQTFHLSNTSFFTVNNKGEIRTNGTFDYEQTTAYALQVYAVNAAGKSNTVNVEVSVTNVADVIPLIMGFDTSVNKHIEIGSILGTVSIEKVGDSPITKFTTSEPDTFEISIDGLVTTKALLTKESYSFEVVATNDAGTDTGLINLTVEDSFTINFINGHSIVDMDLDGDLDVIDTDGEVKWHENKGNNEFVSHNLYIPAQLVFTEDIDNDRDVDLITREGSDIVIYKNDGDQNFVEVQRITREYGFHYDSNGIYLADMDNDGRIDILAAWFGQDWYKNEKDGTFTKHTLSPRGKDIIAFDIDSDGDMDFIESDNNVFWHENNGTQVFVKHQLSDDDIGGASSYAIDIDNDNDIDIVSTRRWSYGIDLYLNDGNQNFTKVLVSTSKNSGYTYAVDIDKDGYIDILNGTTWYKNDGNNNFVQEPVLSLDNQTLIELVN